MKRKTTSACRDDMLELIKRPQGFRSVELKAVYPQGAMQKSLSRLVADGQAFAARMSARHIRYFGTAKEAEFYQSQRRVQVRPDRPTARGHLATHLNAFDAPPAKYHHHPSPMPRPGEMVSPGSARRGGAHWNPKAREGDPDYIAPHFPVDDQGRPLYRITRGPSPQPATRSNTHAE